jgi:hypothetical protein
MGMFCIICILDGAITQLPAYFVKKNAFDVQKLVPRPSACSRLVPITAIPNDRSECSVSSIDSFYIPGGFVREPIATHYFCPR